MVLAVSHASIARLQQEIDPEADNGDKVNSASVLVQVEHISMRVVVRMPNALANMERDQVGAGGAVLSAELSRAC